MTYVWKIIMNNGNQYEILSNKSREDVDELIHDIFGRRIDSKVISDYDLLEPISAYDSVLINSDYISEVLYIKEVN